jgi:hypothetical protein
MKGILTIGLVLTSVSSQAIVVDNFLSGSYDSGGISSGSDNSWISATVLGEIRYQNLSVTSNPLVGTAKCRVITSPGVLEVSTDTDVDVNYTLGFGYATSSLVPASNQLNQNFSTIPFINLGVRTNDIAQPVTITLFTNGGANSYSRTLTVGGGIVSPAPVNYLFDFSSVAANLGDVDGIKIFFDPAPGGDFSLNGVQAVPEPASLSVLALCSILILKRKKK